MPLFFGFISPGPIELLVVCAVILLLFGNRLPSVMRSLGRGIVEFKKGVKGVEEDVEGAGEDKIESQQPAGEVKQEQETPAEKPAQTPAKEDAVKSAPQ